MYSDSSHSRFRDDVLRDVCSDVDIISVVLTTGGSAGLFASFFESFSFVAIFCVG